MAIQTLPLFPLSQPIFPEGVVRLTIFEVRYLHLIKHCQQEGIEFGIVPLADGHEVQKRGRWSGFMPSAASLNYSPWRRYSPQCYR